MTAKQLRASILQLAVQGKLVPQDPADEPASELLARIRAEKARLVKEGKLKKEKNSSEIFVGSDGATYEKFADGTTKDISDEIPFDLPKGWAWARLGEVCEVLDSRRKPVTKSERRAGPIPYYGASGVQDHVDAWLFDEDLLLLGEDGAKWGAGEPSAFQISGKTWVNNHAHVLRFPDFIHLSFMAAVLTAFDLSDWITGTTVKKLTQARMVQILLPIPPSAEQKRIIAKVDELLPLLAKYDETQKAAENHTASFPDAFRKSVLQAAVQGKLVSQNPADEPAEKTLARLLANANGQTMKRGKGKSVQSRVFRGSDKRTYETRDGETVCIDDEVPFDIPDNWAWVRASSLGTLIRGNGIKRNETTQHGVPCIRYGELYTTYRIRIESVVSRTSAVVAAKAQPVEKNDILLTLTGENKEEIGMADAFLADEPAVAGGDLCVWHGHGQNPLYLAYVLMSPFLVRQKAEASNGDIIVHLSAKSASDLLLPLPPIAEQGRIVAEIERLLALGDRLRETL